MSSVESRVFLAIKHWTSRGCGQYWRNAKVLILVVLFLCLWNSAIANEIGIYKGAYTIVSKSDVAATSYPSFCGREANRVPSFLICDLTSGEAYIIPYFPRNRSHYWFGHFRNGSRFCVNSYSRSFVTDSEGAAVPYEYLLQPLQRGARRIWSWSDNVSTNLDGYAGNETKNATVGYFIGTILPHQDAPGYGFPRGYEFPKLVVGRSQVFQNIPYGIRTSGRCNAYFVDGDSYYVLDNSYRYVMNRNLSRSANDPTYPPLNGANPGTIEFGINLVRAVLLDGGYREFVR